MSNEKSPFTPEVIFEKPLTWSEKTVSFLRGRFSGGLLFIAPFVITYLIFKWLYNTASGVLEPVVTRIFGRDIPGLSVAILITLIFVIGLIAIRVIGQRLLYTLEAGLIRVPVVGPTFNIIKQLTSTLGPGSGMGFSRVVEVEYPGKGLWSIGFLTSIITRGAGEKFATVYIPTAPTPNSGYLALIRLEDVYDLDMTANEALRMIISAGIAAPARLTRDSPFSAAHSPGRDPGTKPLPKVHETGTTP